MSTSFTTAAYLYNWRLMACCKFCADILRLPVLWRMRFHNRRRIAYLREVSPHLIADIGLTAEAAGCEANKAFWRPSQL